MHIRRLAIVAPTDMVWTIYNGWRPWSRVRTPSLFLTDDLEGASCEKETAKQYAKVDPEFSVDPNRVIVATISLIRIEPHAEDI